jgi:hypothetical protein
MKTLDLRKQYKHLYLQPASKISILEIPEFQFLAVDGAGDPNKTPDFQTAVEALYAVAYGLKFSLKKRARNPVDYPVMALEGLWWTPDMRDFDMRNKDIWLWRMMIMQPPIIEADMVAEMKALTAKKKDLASLDKLHLVRYNEGLSAQILHVGPYSMEEPTIRRLHEFILSEGFERKGIHHEIYIGDPRRTDPSKLKTVVRQPIGK